MDDEDDKKGSVSTIGALLERIPIMDGGGRRRLTAGTIVVLTGVLVIDSLRTAISSAITARDISLTLLLAGAALLIYATGVIVELVGEVFLARAVSNFVWAYVDVSNRTRNWRRLYQPLIGVYVPIWGTLQAIGNFIAGLFGSTQWRMRPMWRLSARAREIFELQPPPVRSSIEQALGLNAEFGRKALIDQLPTSESRRWARRQMDRPKDVLAIVSAIIISLLLFLVASPEDFTPSPDVNGDLLANRAILEETGKGLASLLSSKEIAELQVRAAMGRETKGDQTTIDALGHLKDLAAATEGLARLTYPAFLADQRSVTDYFFVAYVEELVKNISTSCDVGSWKENGIDKDNANKIASVALAVGTACAQLRTLNRLERTLATAHQQIQFEFEFPLIRIATILAALFLYVGFFNTLTASTISVIEMLALEASHQNAKSEHISSQPPQESADT
jgi:hypothetical protein